MAESANTGPTIVVDTREQQPWVFSPRVSIVRKAMAWGDYSLEGYETVVAVERKSREDLVNTLAQRRERFFEEMRALSEMRECDGGYASVVVESPLAPIMRGNYTSEMQPNAVLGLCASIEAQIGVPVHFLDNRAAASVFVEAVLVQVWRSFVLKEAARGGAKP